ncbi:hypothetical protein Sjap_001454 [Stephania japonica]|uniref:MORF/ORRM1/DAG-like MORF domain-containing protein n=1 Tax=Stephania japonica TaxID=461633 RepID=A0AAP0KMA0_9MAGN
MLPRRALISSLRQRASSSLNRNPNPNPTNLSTPSSIRLNQSRSLHLGCLFSASHLAPPLLGNGGIKLGFNAGLGVRGLAMRSNDSSNRPPKETILLDGCDFEHWLVVVEPPDPSLTRDEIFDSYIKTLAQVVGSEEEARMKLYSVSTKHYFALGVLVSEELSYKIKELPNVRWVLPDSYLDVRNKSYGGEPVIGGQLVPYDPKYHEEWVRNNARANERSRRNDRPRNYDRSRRRENMMNRDMPPPPPPPSQGANQGMAPHGQNQDFMNRPNMQNRNMPPPPGQNQGFGNTDVQPPPSQPPPMHNQGFQNGYASPPMSPNRDGPPPFGNQGFQNPNMPPPNQNWSHQNRPPHLSQNQGYMNRDASPSQNWNYQNRDGAPPIPNRDFQGRDAAPPMPNRDFQGRDVPPPTPNRDLQSRDMGGPQGGNFNFNSGNVQNRDYQSWGTPAPGGNYNNPGNAPNREFQSRDVPETEYQDVANRNF